MNLRRILLRPEYILIEPGINPLDDEELTRRERKTLFKKLLKVGVVVWLAVTAVAVWYAVAQPGKATPLAPTAPAAVLSATEETPTPTASTDTAIPATDSPTATPLLGDSWMGNVTGTPYIHLPPTLRPPSTEAATLTPTDTPTIVVQVVTQTVVVVVQTVIVEITATPGPTATGALSPTVTLTPQFLEAKDGQP